MKRQKEIIALVFILILFSILFIGCENIIPNSLSDSGIFTIPIGPISGWIVVENGIETIKDCTPVLSIYSEGAAYMSFSGDGENWTNWVDYDDSYEEFNIANGLNGTEFGSGTRYVYVRFKDEDGNLSPSEELAWDAVNYEMGELFSIKILPQEATISVNSSYLFTLHGYDLKLNEVPLESSKINWSKSCGVGELSPTTGLFTTYTAPSIPGKRNITAHHNNLRTGAVINVIEDN
ncbi:MAG TPA: hypothetical protein ENG48_10295 [Candidatus Atribacteria bacterium]|nr:hypothetical protein [Candidatus Atribacteria bacterium]